MVWSYMVQVDLKKLGLNDRQIKTLEMMVNDNVNLNINNIIIKIYNIKHEI